MGFLIAEKPYIYLYYSLSPGHFFHASLLFETPLSPPYSLLVNNLVSYFTVELKHLKLNVHDKYSHYLADIPTPLSFLFSCTCLTQTQCWLDLTL